MNTKMIIVLRYDRSYDIVTWNNIVMVYRFDYCYVYFQ